MGRAGVLPAVPAVSARTTQDTQSARHRLSRSRRGRYPICEICVICGYLMQFSTEETFAKQLDAEDPLRSIREKFYLPRGEDGMPVIYFSGNSLGLLLKTAHAVF